MAVITKISSQKNNKVRYSVYIDDGSGEAFGFGVDEDTLIRFGLRKGLEINEAAVQEILREDKIQKAHNLSLSYLSYRMRTEHEMISYMKKKEVDEAIIPIVIEKLKANGYLNDLLYAKSYVREKKRLLTKGPLLLKRELNNKGIAETHIEEALREFTADEQLETAVRFIQKKTGQYRKNSQKEVIRKLGMQLQQKGFPLEIIQEALNDMPLQDKNEEREALRIQAEKAHRRYKKYEGAEYNRRMKQYLYGKGFQISDIEQALLDFNHETN
ncbi:recombination regulator RecX [Pueribacillus theae]|uniref:recombination regulator RecX n=1 Tax=Pueribacillus theae TaxID=2171751 RepID=UPI001402BE58|nr:recombination regulator RecX [Pueribacillus theae]